MLSKRIQILVDDKKYKELKDLGRKSHKSVGELFREAIELYGGRMAGKAQRMKVVERMSKLQAAVSDWPKMEKSILRSRAK